MQQRDLLKDQIEQIGKTLGKVIARFLGLKNSSALEQAVIQTNTALKELLDFDLQFFLGATEEEAQRYTLGKLQTAENVELLAHYLTEIGDQKWLMKETEALSYYHKAISLYDLISNLTKTFSIERSKKEYTLRLKIERAEVQ